jgi:hypothetical protein
VPNEQEEFRRSKQRRRTFATAELPDERVHAIGRHVWTNGMRILMPCLSKMTKQASVTPDERSDIRDSIT